VTLTKHPKTLLTIVTEAVLEGELLRDLRERGAHSWVVGEVHGASIEGVREGAWEADRTVEMKFICNDAVADALAEHVLAQYAPHYSVALYFSPVAVVRAERY
jgi:nitrogen regulatory protein P-II 2